MIFTKEAYQSAKFQTFDCSGEISPNLYFDRLLLLKVYTMSAKNVQRSYIYLMILKSDAKFEEKPIFCFKNDKNLVNFDPSAIICTLIGPFCAKCITFDLKMYRGFIFHDTEASSVLKKNWLVVWKMTWRIWQIFIRTFESVKTGTFILLFKVENAWAKNLQRNNG